MAGRLKVPSGLTLAGSVLAVTIVGVAVIGPFVEPHSPTAFVGGTFAPPSLKLPFGTDVLGRDTFARVLDGGWRILGLSLIATLIGVLSGAILGVWAGDAKGLTDETVMRSGDVVMAFPQTILVLLFVSVVGAKLWLLTLLVGVIHTPQVARVARAATLRVAGEDFVLHARSIGVPRWRILTHEILPNIASPLLVEFGLRLAYSITLVAGLSFLGFGVQPPQADWGLMINENRIGLLTCPWPVLIPVVLIALLTIGMNLLTDAAAGALLGRGRIRAPDSVEPSSTVPELGRAEVGLPELGRAEQVC